MENIKICITSLADYNGGTLLYEWFDLGNFETVNDLKKSINEWLKKLDNEYPRECEREEFFISDYIWCFKRLDKEKYDIEYYFNFQKNIQKYRDAIEKYGKIIVDESIYLKVDTENIDNHYVKTYENINDYYKYVQDELKIPENVRRYFNVEDYVADSYFRNRISCFENQENEQVNIWHTK